MRVRLKAIPSAAASTRGQLAAEAESCIGERLLHTDGIPYLHTAEWVERANLPAARAVTASLQEARHKAGASVVGAALRLLFPAERLRSLHAVGVPLLRATEGIGGTHQLTAGRVVAEGRQMRREAILGKHIAASTTLRRNQLDALFIPLDITAIRLHLADLRAARWILATWLRVCDQTTARCGITARIRCAETGRSCDARRVPVHAATKWIAVADTVAAGRGAASGRRVDHEATLLLAPAAAGTGHA